jgi:hypothetical protein
MAKRSQQERAARLLPPFFSDSRSSIISPLNKNRQEQFRTSFHKRRNYLYNFQYPFREREQIKIFFSTRSQNANGPKYFFWCFHKTRTGQKIFNLRLSPQTEVAFIQAVASPKKKGEEVVRPWRQPPLSMPDNFFRHYSASNHLSSIKKARSELLFFRVCKNSSVPANPPPRNLPAKARLQGR